MPTATKKVSARDAAIAALTRAGTPMTASAIIDKVQTTKGVVLAGKTPRATIQAILSTEAKREGGAIRRVETGVYEAAPATTTPAA